MAYSFVQYTGNGSTTLFNVPFGYISKSHVTVKVDGVSTSFTWNSDTVVSVSPAPTNGAVVEVRRTTPITTAVVDFQDAGTITEAMLDENTKQMLYIAQEAFDTADLSIQIASDNTWDAESKRIKNVASPATDTDAANKNYVDQTALGALPLPLSQANGGTGAASAPAARTALAVPGLADLADTADVAKGDALLGGKRTSANAVGFTFHTYTDTRAFHLNLDFGAVGDGVADDTAAFINAATALRTAGGGVLVLSPGKTYKVLPSGGSAGAKLIDLQNCKGVVIEGQGSKILTGSVTLIQSAVDLNATTDVVIRNLRFESGSAVLDAANGIEWIKAHQGAKRILLENLDFKFGRIGFAAVGAVNGGGNDADRARDIIAINCDFDTTYYPFNFQGAGDNFFARGIRTRNAGRSYFPYNVRNHDVVLESEHGGPFSDVLLKVYSDTRWYSRLENIKLVYHSVGRTAGSGNQNADEAHVALDFQVVDAATAAPGTMENLDITIDISAQAAPNQSRSIFIVRKYDPAGAADATARGHLLTSTKVRGTGRGLPNLLGDWFRVCTRAGENWTGDVVNGIELGFSALDGNTTQVALAMNGQAFPGLNYHAGVWVNNFMGSNATLSWSNTAGKHVSITRSHFGNYHGGSARNSETYTPAWTADTTDPTLGNGTLLGSYVLHGGLCTANVQLTIGSTTTFGTGRWRFSLPVAAAPAAEMAPALGAALVFDAGTNWRAGISKVVAAGAYMDATIDSTATPVDATTPMVWAAGDVLYLSVTYPIGTF